MTRFVPCGLLLLVGALASGCSGQGSSSEQRAPQGGAVLDKSKYLLAEQPADSKGVIAVRQQAKDGDEVVVVGKVGGDRKPWVEGRAAFLIVDPSARY